MSRETERPPTVSAQRREDAVTEQQAAIERGDRGLGREPRGAVDDGDRLRQRASSGQVTLSKQWCVFGCDR